MPHLADPDIFPKWLLLHQTLSQEQENGRKRGGNGTRFSAMGLQKGNFWHF